MQTFSGIVTDSASHLPIELANVALLDANGNVITGIQTGQDGRFSFTIADSSQVSGLRFSFVGYNAQTWPKQSSPYNIKLEAAGIQGPTATIIATATNKKVFALGLLILLLFIIYKS